MTKLNKYSLSAILMTIGLNLSYQCLGQKHYQPIDADKELVFEDNFDKDEGQWIPSNKKVKLAVKDGQATVKSTGRNYTGWNYLVASNSVETPINWEMEFSFKWTKGSNYNKLSPESKIKVERIGIRLDISSNSDKLGGLEAKWGIRPSKLSKNRIYVLRIVQFNGVITAVLGQTVIYTGKGQFSPKKIAIGLPNPKIGDLGGIKVNESGQLELRYLRIFRYSNNSLYENGYNAQVKSARLFDENHIINNTSKGGILELSLTNPSRWNKLNYEKILVKSIPGFINKKTPYGDERWYSRARDGDSYPITVRANITLQKRRIPGAGDINTSITFKLTEEETEIVNNEKLNLEDYSLEPTGFDESRYKRFVALGDDFYKNRGMYDNAFKAYNYANLVGSFGNQNCNQNILDAAMSLVYYGYDSDLLFTTLRELNASNTIEVNARDHLLIRRYWLMNDRSFRKDAKELLQKNPQSFSKATVGYLKSISSLDSKKVQRIFDLETLENIAFQAQEFEASATLLKERIENSSEKVGAYDKFKLGTFMKYGIGFEKNLKKANELLLEACAGDVYESCRILLEEDNLDAKYIIAWDFDVNYDQEEAQTFFYNVLRDYDQKNLNHDSRWSKAEEREKYHRLYSYENVTYSRERRRSTQEAFGYESGNYVYKTESYSRKESILRKRPLNPLATTNSGLLSLYIDFHNLNNSSTKTEVQKYLQRKD
ncbi:MAG: hypothetical protein AAFX87_18505 [Bacteroidota bacterium]